MTLHKRLLPQLIIGLLLLFIIISTASSQNRKYERKSVSSLGSVLYKKYPEKKMSKLVLNLLKYRIEVPRFDYNTISQDAVREFVSTVNTTDLTPGAIAQVLDNTIIPKLEKTVTAVAEIRATQNLKEEDLARAAVDKMKGSGLTVEDVLKVINSAYMYLPVVTSFEETSKDGNISVSVKGYILWYQMVKGADGTYKAVLLSDPKSIAEGTGSGKLGESYKLKSYSVDAARYAEFIAVNTWAKNLAVTMKEIPDFRLSAEIKDTRGNYVYAGIGTKEGIGLDDGFNVIDFYEDEKGNVQARDLGFYRVIGVANNIENLNRLSGFNNYIGSGIERGMVLYERPRLGIDIIVRPKFFTLNMPKSDLGIFSDDVKSAFGGDAIFAKNLAKLTGISQFFVNVEVGWGIVNVKGQGINTPLLHSYYAGLSKKLWFDRMNLDIGAGYGYNSIELKDASYTYALNAYGLKIDASLNYLISADVSFGFYVGYKMTSNIADCKVTSNAGVETTFIIPNSSTNFSGISFGLNLSYALPGLSFDPFAFLSSTENDD